MNLKIQLSGTKSLYPGIWIIPLAIVLLVGSFFLFKPTGTQAIFGYNTEFDFSQLYLSFYNKEHKIELLDRSKYWCVKRGLGELFYKYYNINESNIEISNITIIDNIPNSKNGNKYHGLNDCDGIPMDRKLDELFNKKEKGIFIDVGAHNGIQQSNTLFLENHRNWSGIVITPNKQKYDECKINRPKSTCECYACVSPDYKLSTIKGDFWKLEGSIDATRSKSNNTEFFSTLLS